MPIWTAASAGAPAAAGPVTDRLRRKIIPQGRLSRAADGTIAYQMKRRYSDGREVLAFEPREFLLRLCALVPPRRFQMIRHAGLLAPHARGRYAITGRGMHDGKEPAASP